MPSFVVEAVHRKTGADRQFTVEAVDERAAMREVTPEYVIGKIHPVHKRPPAHPIDPGPSRLLTHPTQTIAAGVALGILLVIGLPLAAFILYMLVLGIGRGLGWWTA